MSSKRNRSKKKGASAGEAASPAPAPPGLEECADVTQQETAAEVLEAQAHETLSHMTLDRPRRDGVRTPSREKLRTNSAGDLLGDCPATDEAATSPSYARSISHPADNQDQQAQEILRASPLQRFTIAKQHIGSIFREFQRALSDTDAFVQSPPHWVEHQATGENIVHTEKMTDRQMQQLQETLLKISGITDMVSRDNMKVVFIGHTSNGKSSTINALLGRDILPSSYGHTTNCFVALRGVDAAEGDIVLDATGERKAISEVKELAHALRPNRLAANSLVTLNWPRSQCRLLEADVEIMDSPGLDINDLLDSGINAYCANADVFVLVANSESTINNVERKFFATVQDKLSRPNIFVLFNKWDNVVSGCTEEELPPIQQQHVDVAKDLLGPAAAAQRVFFVSSQEALWSRAHPEKFKKASESRTGVHQRLMEFQNFEQNFEQCISTSAIHTRFEAHAQQGVARAAQLAADLADLEARIRKQSDRMQEHLDQQCKYFARLDTHAARAIDELRAHVAQASEMLLADVAETLETGSLQILETAVSEFYHPHFNPSDPAVMREYADQLTASLQQRLNEEVAERVTRRMHEHFENLQKTIYSQLQQLLPAPSLEQLQAQFQLQGLGFNPRMTFACDTYARGFTPDLRFTFSLAPSRVFAALMTNHYARTAIVWLLPTPFLPPMASAGFTAMQPAPAPTGILGTLSAAVATPQGLALVSVASTLLLREWGIKLVTSCGLIYGGMYLFEFGCYRRGAKERKFKKQFVNHMSLELRRFSSHSSSMRRDDFREAFGQQLTRAGQHLIDTRNRLQKEVADGKEELHALLLASEQAAKLKNSMKSVVLGLQRFLGTFMSPATA